MPAMESRMAMLAYKRPPKWRKKHARLAILKRALLIQQKEHLVKGWRGKRLRRQRYEKIQRLLKHRTMEQVGRMVGGISRQRVHQIVKAMPQQPGEHQ